MPLCTMRVGTAAFENLSCFQFVEPNADSRLISERSFYDLHLLIRWAQGALVPLCGRHTPRMRGIQYAAAYRG